MTAGFWLILTLTANGTAFLGQDKFSTLDACAIVAVHYRMPDIRAFCVQEVQPPYAH